MSAFQWKDQPSTLGTDKAFRNIGRGLTRSQVCSRAMTTWIDGEVARTGVNPGTIVGLAKKPEGERAMPDWGRGRKRT